MRTTLRTMLLVAALAPAACTPLLPAERALPEGGSSAALRSLLAPGTRVALLDSTRCDATVADDLGTLVDGQGQKLAGLPLGKAPSLWRVGNAVIRLQDGDDAGFLGVKLLGERGEAKWIRVEAGRSFTCLVPASDEVVAAVKLVGHKVVFAPQQSTCRRIEAAGSAALSTFFENDAAVPIKVAGLATIEDGAPWLRVAGGSVRVPYDVLRDCFVDAESAGDDPPGALALLHTPSGRCTASEDGGKEHVECRSTIGVWQGQSGDEGATSLHLVRRTLGPVHFIEGRPVDGARYARTVIAVSMGRPRDDAARDLYAAMERSIARALAGGDGSVRVAPHGDPAVGYQLHVDAAELKIGELIRRQDQRTSQYQNGERDVPNPEYAKAESALRAAESAVEQSKRDFDDAQEKYERNKETIAAARQTCLQGCGLIQNAQQAQICRTGCEGGNTIGGAFLHTPTRDGISKAEGELSRAREDLASTPKTVKEPIMKSWSYTATVFGRSASTTLRVALSPKGGAARTLELPLSQSWEDYETQADGAHNVAAHEPDRGPINRPEALVPWLASKASERLAERLRAVLDEAEIEDAKKALAGGEQPKPGFEAVDAKAIQTAGARLGRAVRRGQVKLTAQKAWELPSDSVTLEPDECLLAVAVAERDSTTTSLTLASDGDEFGDLRWKRHAAVEICGNELPAGQRSVRLHLQSPADGAVTWGLYRTRGAVKAAKAKQDD